MGSDHRGIISKEDEFHRLICGYAKFLTRFPTSFHVKLIGPEKGIACLFKGKQQPHCHEYCTGEKYLRPVLPQ